ncbi:MAG: hypothetical protein HYV92_03395 [Candidatus Rokubacteria bacterium]|nr:hypothetical protein [Candidatus Rokubacteria bacterium]MBI3029618.1 hypothetical protein [Candidatus Rokubacteria bacterium]
MSAPWIVLAAIVALAVAYVLLPVVGAVFVRFRAPRELACPETGKSVRVGAAAGWAAFTAAFRHPVLRVKNCSLWPGRSRCEQGCLESYEKAKPAA